MSRYKKLLSNTLILSIGTFSSKLLVYFLMPLYTALLSKEQYGTADLITNAANFLIPFCCIGITHAVFRFAADSEEDARRVFSSGISVLSLSSVAFLALSPLLFFVPFLGEFSWLLVVYVICSNFHTLCAEYIRAKGHTTLFAVQGIVGTALTIGFNLLFLIPMEMGVVGYVLSVAVADAVGTVFLIIAAKLHRDFSAKLVSREKIKEMLKFSLPMMPTTVIWWITNVSDRYIVTYLKGSGENGLYSAAYKIPTLITLVATVFIEAWQFSAISDSKDGEDRNSFFGEVFERYQAIIFFGCACLIPLSQIATRALLDASYYEAWTFIPVLLVATVFSSLTSFMGTIYTVSKRTVMSMVSALFGAVLNIILNILLIPDMGAQGAGIATMISYMAVFLIRAVSSKRYMPFKLGVPKLVLNTAIIIAQAVLMLIGFEYNLWAQIVLVLALALLNARSVITAVWGILKNFKKISKKT